MKFMSFNNSCSHAAICTLLERKGIDLEPDAYLEKMKAYLFMDQDFSTGAMLQSDEAYSFGLVDYGLSFHSVWISHVDELRHKIKEIYPCMLPLKLEERKHAVILEKWSSGEVELLNMKRKEEKSPDRYLLTEEEFLEKLSYPLPLGKVNEGSYFSSPLVENSPLNHRSYKKKLEEFALKNPSLDEMKGNLSFLRSLLLDLPDALRRVQGLKDYCDELLALQEGFIMHLRENEKAPFSWRELVDWYGEYILYVEKEVKSLLL